MAGGIGKEKTVKLKRMLIGIAFVILSACALLQSTKVEASANAPINGVWRGQMNGLPAVTLLVTDEGGSLVGAVLFYFQQRTNEKSPWTTTTGLPEPMLNPKFVGKALTFHVSHRRAHPPGSLKDPPMPFRLTLVGPDKAELVNEKEGQALTLIRSEY
jgi:hypothetical protein